MKSDRKAGVRLLQAVQRRLLDTLFPTFSHVMSRQDSMKPSTNKFEKDSGYVVRLQYSSNRLKLTG